MAVSVEERACALFFFCVAMELGAQRTAATQQDIENLVAPWRSAAEQCRLAISRLGPSRGQLAKGLALSAEYFEDSVQFAWQDANGPYMLKRRSRKPEDDIVLGLVRALTWETHALYGSFQYGVLAKVAAVVLQTNVTEKSVRNWCSDLFVAR